MRGTIPHGGPHRDYHPDHKRGYEHLFGLSERQRKVMAWVESVGPKKALEMFREKEREKAQEED
jgi:hypothetical protein